MKPLPIACELTPAQLAARRTSLLADLFARATVIAPTDSGYRFTFAADDESMRLLFAALDAERRCCRFLRFALTIEQDLGPVSLEIDGPEGAREFVALLLPSPEPKG